MTIPIDILVSTSEDIKKLCQALYMQQDILKNYLENKQKNQTANHANERSTRNHIDQNSPQKEYYREGELIGSRASHNSPAYSPCMSPSSDYMSGEENGMPTNNKRKRQQSPGYLAFYEREESKIREQHPRYNRKKITPMVSSKWKRLSKEEQSKWEAEATAVLPNNEEQKSAKNVWYDGDPNKPLMINSGPYTIDKYANSKANVQSEPKSTKGIACSASKENVKNQQSHFSNSLMNKMIPTSSLSMPKHC